jgi:hypothetical protein
MELPPGLIKKYQKCLASKVVPAAILFSSMIDYDTSYGSFNNQLVFSPYFWLPGKLFHSLGTTGKQVSKK